MPEFAISQPTRFRDALNEARRYNPQVGKFVENYFREVYGGYMNIPFLKWTD